MPDDEGRVASLLEPPGAAPIRTATPPRADVQSFVMTRRVRHLVALVAAATALCVPGAAWASPQSVIRDCASDGSLDGSYSDADKRAAIGQLGAELQEYSDCRSVIAASIGGGSTGSGSSSSSDDDAAVAADKAKTRKNSTRVKTKKKARDRRATQVALNDDALRPNEPAALESEDTSNGISTPVLLALIALALLCAAGVLFALSKRNPRVADVFRRVSFARFRR